MSARATRGNLDYHRIIEQNPYVRDGSPIVLIPKTPRSPQRVHEMPSTQRRRLQPSATPGINDIRDIDQDPARLLVFVVFGFVLRHLLRCGRCHFTTQVLTSHAREMLWRFAGVHIHCQDLDGLIFRLEHATQTLGYNVAAVTPFDRRFCAVLRSTRGFLLDPPKPGFEAFYQGGATWPDLSRRWEHLSNDIAASEDGRRFNVAALNEALDSQLHECHYSRLPPPLVDAPTFSGYRQTPPLQNEVDLPLQNHTQSIVHALPTPPSTSSEDPEPSSQGARRRQPSRPARRRAQSAMARAAVAEADLTEREDSEDRRLVEEDEAVSSIEKSPQKSQNTVKRKRDDALRPRAAASPGQESAARPSGSNNPPRSPSQGSEDQKPPRKRYKNKTRRNFYVPSPEPPSRFVPNSPPLEQTESGSPPKDSTPKVEPEDSVPEQPRPSGSGAAFAEVNSDADIIARLTREFAANLGDDDYPENTVSVIADQFGFRTGGRDPPELETVEELVHATLRDYEAQRRAEAEARQAQARILAEAAVAAIQARKKEQEVRAKAEQEAREKAMAEGGAAARAQAEEREKRRRALLEVPATRAIREAQARLEERRRRDLVANRARRAQEAAALRVEAEKKAAEEEKKKAANAKAQAGAAKSAIASHAAVQQQTPSDSDCSDCSDCDSDSGGSVSDNSGSNDSSSGDSAFDETSSDESSSDESSSDEASSNESSSNEAASLPSTSEPSRIVLRFDHGTFDREVLQMRLKVTQSSARQDQNLLEELTRREQRRR
ncbi:hypothetical protein IWX90DRAFT_18398 [Phyllosticta citrichinensis]|uniref:Uncharacterized protein n=1 Tax=Phyllosticta citrichinensis TaxID=1130410 RepID=A0ABR1Y715_9PEZI